MMRCGSCWRLTAVAMIRDTGARTQSATGARIKKLQAGG